MLLDKSTIYVALVLLIQILTYKNTMFLEPQQGLCLCATAADMFIMLFILNTTHKVSRFLFGNKLNINM